MKNCQYCGYPMQDNMQFCPKCGSSQPNGQVPQQMPQNYNNQLNYYSQNPYSQQPNYGNPTNNISQQPNMVNWQTPGSQFTNPGTHSQNNVNPVIGQQNEIKSGKKKKTGCLTILLWVLFFPIMLWIYAIRKKKVLWYLVAAAVSLFVIVFIAAMPKNNVSTKSSVSTSSGSYEQSAGARNLDDNNDLKNQADILADDVKSADEISSAKSSSASADFTIKDLTIVDNANVLFKIIEAKTDRIWGFTLKAYCENKIADKTLMFSLDDVSVNGYMMDPFWATEVPAGKKANKDISFSSAAFKTAGITVPEQIKFTLRVYDTNDWSSGDVLKEKYAIYPTGLSEDKVTIPARKITDKERIIIDNDLCTFVILESRVDNIWGYTLDCYLENKTNDKKLMFSWDDVSVNGYAIDPFWSSSIPSNSKKYSSISFSSSKFEENSISAVEDIEFKLRIYDDENWGAEDFVNQIFTYQP
ncbi:MAG: zinc ribbon domain-containing protein [Anaerolineaceae bacterium]|nr:zinc ribbon domain-containing protein [Anaerolineaceae bacterium]